MKTPLNYIRTRRAVSSLYQAEDVPTWIKKVIKVSAINHRCKLCKDPKAIEIIRELNESIKKIENIEGYFIFDVCYSESTSGSEYSLWCNYARLPKTASIFSWLIYLEEDLDSLVENVRQNKDDIIEDIENIIKALNAAKKQA